MNLPANVITAGKAAVQAQWSDRVTIDRDFEPLVNNQMQHLTISDVLCHFSQSSAAALEQSSTVATTTSMFTLYVDPSITLVTGDTLTISHKGQTFIGEAGEPFNGTFSNFAKVTVKKIS